MRKGHGACCWCWYLRDDGLEGLEGVLESIVEGELEVVQVAIGAFGADLLVGIALGFQLFALLLHQSKLCFQLLRACL
jgi:hypothetical protein